MAPDEFRKQMTYDAARKSIILAYLLWFFLGTFGAHRFYIGAGGGVAMLILNLISLATTFLLIGYLGLTLIAIWWVIDALLIPGMVARKNLELIALIDG